MHIQTKIHTHVHPVVSVSAKTQITGTSQKNKPLNLITYVKTVGEKIIKKRFKALKTRKRLYKRL